MSNIQIKRVPEEVHDELRRRAAQAGQTVRDYVLDLIRRDQAQPSRHDWAEAVRELTPVDLGGPAARVVRGERKRRGGDGGRR